MGFEEGIAGYVVM